MGWVKIDGIDTIVLSKPIKKYNDVYVGLVCVGLNITMNLLRSFSDDPGVVVEFMRENQKILSADHKENFVYSKSLKGIIKNTQKPLINVVVHFKEDKYFSDLLIIRKSLYWSSITIIFALVFLLIFLLNQQLKSYSMLVEHILNYANNKMSADKLKKRLKGMKHGSVGDSAKITSALIQMLDVIETNFKKIEKYNIELDQTNQQIEKSLKEIKKLSGLLPICASCKKIRDDKGYWNHLEEYIQTHSDVSFSHGLCSECSDKLYDKEDWYIEMKEEESQEK